ncbi:MAG: hypothetical protein ACRD3M_16380, partial [Thermoanaerobaculia bacterium]
MRRRAVLVACLAAPALLLAAEKPRTAVPRLEPSRLKAFKARSIGPAVMGGRISEIALDPENASVYYLAYATGGVAKTSNNGASFQAIFEKEAVASIGAVAVAPSDPKTV